jgi:hypothetical protein
MIPRLLLVLALVCLLAPALVFAEEPAADDEDPIPPLADEAVAEEALAVFNRDFKARGYKGDEKLAMKEVAMRTLAGVQHPRVVDRLYRLTRDRDADIRTLAVLYLGYQRALPGYAGPLVVKAIKAQNSDAVFAMFGIEAIESLDYRGGVPLMRALMAHKDEGVKKVAILYIGDAHEWRMLEDLLKLMKELKIDKGWKTEGHEVRYDSGAAGDADQKKAEAIYKAKYGKAKGKAKSGGRAMRDMKPVLLETMKNLTGQDFFLGASARDWADENKELVAKEQKALDEREAKQKAEAEALTD